MLKTALETSAGRMIPTLAFDGKTVVGRSLSQPTLVRRWDARTGEEIGAGYQFDAWALAIAPRSLGDGSVIELPGLPANPSTRIVYASPEQYGDLDVSAEAVTSWLCVPLANALASGLIPTAPGVHPCTMSD